MEKRTAKSYTVIVDVKKEPEPRIVYRTDGLETESRPYHSIFVERKDTINWECRYPYTVHFGYGTPLEQVSYRSDEGGRLMTSIRPDVPFGHYKYFVAVWFNGTILADDPGVIVKPGGGSGG